MAKPRSKRDVENPDSSTFERVLDAKGREVLNYKKGKAPAAGTMRKAARGARPNPKHAKHEEAN